MKAVVVDEFGPASVLTVKDIPKPVAGDDEVLVRLHAAGVNPVETYIRAGDYARLPSLPWTPGSEGAGVIEGGERDGERVYVTGARTGTYAQYAVCSADQVHPLPDAITFEQGAAIGVAYRTAHRALFIRAGVKEGDTVMVHGASGGVGLATVQLAKDAGCTVIGTAGTPEGLEATTAHGANVTFNHKEVGYMDKVVEWTDGVGPKHIVEMLANVNLNEDMRILARGGVIAVVGNRGEINVNPRLLMLKEGCVLGVLGGSAEEIANGYKHIDDALARGALNPHVGGTFELEDVAAAHADVIDKKIVTVGKVVLKL